MSRTRRPLAALAMDVGALISFAVCSNVPAETGSGSSGGNNTAANHEQAVKFAECIRDNGVVEFPDPDASGMFAYGIKYGIKRGSLLDPSTAAWKKAIGACKDLEPPGFIPKTLSAKQMEARLEFAQCMRENGVQDFPDPTDNGPLINVQSTRSKPGFQATMQKCRDLLAGALGASDAEDVGAGRSGRPGCRNRHRRRGGHVQCEARDPGRTGAAGEHCAAGKGEPLRHGLPGWDPDPSDTIGRLAVFVINQARETYTKLPDDGDKVDCGDVLGEHKNPMGLKPPLAVAR